MANISQQDLYDMIQGAQGTTLQPMDIINHLISQGHDIEGYPIANASTAAQNAYHFNKMAQQQGTPVEGISEAGIPPGVGNTGPGKILAVASPALGQEKGVNAMLAGQGIAALGEGLAAVPAGLQAIRNAIMGLPERSLTNTPIPELRQMAGNLLADRSSALEAKVGGFGNDMANGGNIQKIIAQNAQEARQVASGEYEKLKDLAPNTQFAPQNLLKEVYDQGLDLSQLPPRFQNGPLSGFIKDAVDNLGQNTETALSGKQLVALRQELSQLSRAQTGIQGLAGQVTNTGRIANNLIGAIDKDIAAIPEFGEDFAAQHEIARNSWKDFKETYSNPVIEKLMSVDPSDVHSIAFKSPENLQAVQAAAGEDADMVRGLIKKSVTNDLLSKVGNSQTPNKTLENIMSKKPDEIGQLYDPSEIQALQEYLGARKFVRDLPGDTTTDSEATLSKMGGIIQAYAPKTWQDLLSGGAKGVGIGAGGYAAKKGLDVLRGK